MGEPRIVDGRFRLERELGRRHGTVTWLATDLAGGPQAVLKESRLSAAPPAETVSTWEERARALGGLAGRGIPALIAFGCERDGADTVCRLVRRHVPGASLAEGIAAGRRLPEEGVLGLLDRAAGILDPLHRRDPPLVHGNIRPANVIVDAGGDVHLVDFDFAGRAAAPHPLGFRLPWLASPYDPPEADGGSLTPASDVWALGVTVAAALRGADPAPAPGGEAPPSAVGGTGASPAFARLLGRMTDADPGARPRDARRLLEELARLRRPLARRPRRRPLLARLALVAAAVALLRLGTTVLRDRAGEAPPPPQEAPARLPSRSRAEPVLSTDRAAHAAGEPITVRYRGLAGTDGDWITLVPAGTPDDSYRQWFWTGGSGAGSRAFDGQPPGDYEVRVYHDWPPGGYRVQGRLPVRVVAP